MNPIPPNSTETPNATRKIVGSMPNERPRPPATPQTYLSLVERVSFVRVGSSGSIDRQAAVAAAIPPLGITLGNPGLFPQYGKCTTLVRVTASSSSGSAP